MGVLAGLFALIRAFLTPRFVLVAENLALRHQLTVLSRSVKRPKLRNGDRLFWVLLSRLWRGWESSLYTLQPATVVKWHREGFKRYWRWRSRTKKSGRPTIEAEIRDLIRQMSRENPLWGAPRILSELRLLGYEVAERTVAKYIVRSKKPPSQTWKAFLNNHVPDIVAIDLFTVPTVTFRILFCFIVLRHDRRRVVHFNVTEHPSQQWTTQQIIDAFPYDEAPRYMIRDHDATYGQSFRHRIKHMGVRQVVIARRSPWQSP